MGEFNHRCVLGVLAVALLSCGSDPERSGDVAAGCVTDLECKGNRICGPARTCLDPPAEGASGGAGFVMGGADHGVGGGAGPLGDAGPIGGAGGTSGGPGGPAGAGGGPVDACSIALDCGECVLINDCGWCGDRCVTGSERGPAAGRCPSWSWTGESCTDQGGSGAGGAGAGGSGGPRCTQAGDLCTETSECCNGLSCQDFIERRCLPM
jgi:hypothetical protein